MRKSRIITIAMLLLGVGLLGAYYGVRAQEGAPYPPAPVRPPALPYEEEDAPPDNLPPPAPPSATMTPQAAPIPTPITPPAMTPVSDPAPIPLPLPVPPSDVGPSFATPVDAVPPTSVPIAPPNVNYTPTPVAPAPLTPPAVALPIEPPTTNFTPWTPPEKTPLTSQPSTTTAPGFVPVAPMTGQPVSPQPKEPKAFQLVNPIRHNQPTSAPEPSSSAGLNVIADTIPVSRQILPGAFRSPIVVEKHWPASVRSGETLSYVIVVRNVGNQPMNNVRVQDDVGPSLRFVASEPVSQIKEGRVSWMLPVLPAGAERSIRVDVQGMDDADIVSTTQVGYLSATASASTTQSLRPASFPAGLAVSIAGPGTTTLNGKAVFEVRVVNNGNQPAAGLLVQGQLSKGLSHPMGSQIEADLGTVAPGKDKIFKLQTTAVAVGRQTLELTVASQDGQEVAAQSSVVVSEGGLKISIAPVSELQVDRETELRLEISNRNSQAMRNIAVTDTLPDGLELIAVSDKGLFRQESHTVNWLLDTLGPNEAKIVAVKVKAKTPGSFAQEAIVRTDAKEEGRGTGQINVQGKSDLVLKVSDRDDPLEVGKDTVYEIRVINQGNVPATNIQVKATLPQGLRATQAQGPVAYRIEGSQVIFAAYPRLAPQGQAVFQISATALAAGDQRVRVQVVSDQTTAPVTREERTLVYHD